jgi:outer membrane scaffolding protein for murein synthesis (MipA/OmpV family)
MNENTMMQAVFKTIQATVLLVTMSTSLHADEAGEAVETAPPREYSAPGLPLWEAGLIAGGVTQPAYPGADERASLLAGLPYAVYRGEYWRIDRNTVGVRAIRTPRTELDIGFSASLGSRAENIEARRGMDDLGMLLEFGPRLKINLGEIDDGESNSRIQIPVRGVFDANDHMRYHGIAYELQWVADMKLPSRWSVTSNLGALFGDQLLADTFYRVAPAEATAVRPAYDARSGLIALRATLWASRLFTPAARFFSYLRFDSVAAAANRDSPLVRRDTGWTLGVGVAWTLAQSERTAKD